MTGWRLSFCAAPEPIAKAIDAVQSHSTSNPTSFAQKGAVAALTGPQDHLTKWLAEYDKRRRFAHQRLNAIPGVTCCNVKGAFYLFPNISASDLQSKEFYIEELAEKSTFVETAHLLIHGRLPTDKELQTFSGLLLQNENLHEDMKCHFEGFPSNAHPTVTLSAMINASGCFYPGMGIGRLTAPFFDLHAARLISQVRTIAAFSYWRSRGLPIIYPKPANKYTANFLHMMFSDPYQDYDLKPEVVQALDLIFILHADHEQNCSTSTVRMVASSQANLMVSAAASVCALWGPLHGGANQAVIETLKDIHRAGDDGPRFIAAAKDKTSGKRLMGFGHRIYKSYDPRAKIIEKACDELLKTLHVTDPLLDIARHLEDAALRDPYFIVPQCGFLQRHHHVGHRHSHRDVHRHPRHRPHAGMNRQLQEKCGRTQDMHLSSTANIPGTDFKSLRADQGQGMSRSNIAVFLDRDGTLIEDRGHLRDPGEVVFFAGTVDALRRLQAHARLFIVTNQSGVGKGLLTKDEADRINAFVVDQLHRAGVRIAAVYCCPHRRDEGCACIKPRPLFLKRAAAEHGLDLRRSFVVGDHPHDVEFAENVGATGIYVLTGHGAKHRAELLPGSTVVPGIREAADWILACLEMQRQEREHPGLLNTAASILRDGGIVAFPTETVYGLGAVVHNEKAVARVFEVKARPRFDPLIIHVSGLGHLQFLAKNVPAAAQTLMEHFWPGPLTLVLPKSARVPDLVTAGLPTVAVRMPRHPLALELIRRTGAPLAASSANPFGHTSPTTAQHVLDHLAGKADLVLDGGACPVGVESTIVSFACDTPTLLRPGGLPTEEIEALIGPLAKASAKHEQPVTAPGMLPGHYAPRTPFRVIHNMEGFAPHSEERIGLLALKRTDGVEPFAAVEFLSANGDLREAASKLFGALRKLDEQALDLIVAELVPNIGLGLAINDWLLRAAGNYQPQGKNFLA